MIAIPEWEDALVQFKDFLRSRGHSLEIEWVFRDDIWRRNAYDMLVRRAVPPENAAFCRLGAKRV